MKFIPLTQNYSTLVDDEDYDYLNQWNWCYAYGYAVRTVCKNGKQSQVRMHRVILNAPKNKHIDHINRDRLDNRKENLRLVNKSQNNRNASKRKNCKSKYKGVASNKNKWVASIFFNKKRIYLGTFEKEIDAAKAYNEAAIIYFKEYANLNKV